MKNVSEEIDRARGINGLIPLLGWLCRETERVIAADRMPVADVRHIAASLEQIHALLREAADLISMAAVEGEAALVVRELAERYRDLEGKAKELRNDMQRSATLG